MLTTKLSFRYRHPYQPLIPQQGWDRARCLWFIAILAENFILGIDENSFFIPIMLAPSTQMLFSFCLNQLGLLILGLY